MNRADILSLARTEMNKHGLTSWQVKFIRSKSVAGLCWTYQWNSNPNFSRGKIELSTDFFDVFEDHDILEVIRHEIAHALTEDEYVTIQSGPRKGHERRVVHGATWKANARRIGSTGNRCVSREAEQPKGRYKGVCPNGHESIRHRLTHTAKESTSCHLCSNKYDARYRFDWYDGTVLVHRQPKPLGTTTGRFAQTSPNLKTVPRTNPPMVKKPYLPKPNTTWSFDSDELTTDQIRIISGLLTKV